MRRTEPHPSRERQAGVALVIALVFLIALTLIGVGAMQTATLQERMAGSVRDRNIGFQAAEYALRDGEARVVSYAARAGVEELSEFHEEDDVPDWDSITDCDDNDAVRQVETEHPTWSQSPCYFIEDVATPPDQRLEPGDGTGRVLDQIEQSMYRITAIGFGASENARVVLRSTTSGIGDDDSGDGDGNGNGGPGNGGPP